MKTREEIEILAEQWFENATTERWGGEELGFINGYSQCQEDMYEFGKLVLDTFHSEGKTYSGKDRLPRVKFDEWFNNFNKY